MKGASANALREKNKQLKADSAGVGASNANLLSRVDAFQRRIKDLERQIKQPEKNLHNSHRPPSSDNPVHRRKRKSENLVTENLVASQLECLNHERFSVRLLKKLFGQKRRQDCLNELKIGGNVGKIVFQRVDIPEVTLDILDCICEAIACPRCFRKTFRQTNLSGRAGFIGPRLAATRSALSGRYHLCKRQVQEALSSVWAWTSAWAPSVTLSNA